MLQLNSTKRHVYQLVDAGEDTAKQNKIIESYKQDILEFAQRPQDKIRMLKGFMERIRMVKQKRSPDYLNVFNEINFAPDWVTKARVVYEYSQKLNDPVKAAEFKQQVITLGYWSKNAEYEFLMLSEMDPDKKLKEKK